MVKKQLMPVIDPTSKETVYRYVECGFKDTVTKECCGFCGAKYE